MTKLIVVTTTLLAELRDDERGGNLIEYALLLSFIAVAVIFALTQIGEKTLSNTADIINKGGLDADITGGNP